MAETAQTQEAIIVKINPDNAESVDDPKQIERFEGGREALRIGFIATIKAQIDEGNMEEPVIDPIKGDRDGAIRKMADEQAVMAQSAITALGGYGLTGDLERSERIRSWYFGVPLEHVSDKSVQPGEFEVVNHGLGEAIHILREAQPSVDPHLL